VGLIFLMLLMPQVVLYGIAGTSGAVLNARGRFALAAAGPAFENLGIIVTLAVSAVVFGTAPSLETVGGSQLLLLGLGTTAAVGLHAGALWWGTWRLGLGLVPRAGWRDPEVRALVRRVVPSLGYAGLNVLRLFAVLVVANRVPGGVVAFQLALNFFYLPVAVGARPVAVALLPRLARLHRDGAFGPFRDELVRGVGVSLFLTVPAAVAYIVLAGPLARAVSFGEMAGPSGRDLVASSLAALALGVVGEGIFVMATHASYARNDAASPFRSSLVRTGVVVVGGAVAFTRHGPAVLVALGLALSVSNLVGAVHLGGQLRAVLPASGEHVGPAAVRALVTSVVMVIPAYLVAEGTPHLVAGRPGHLIGTALATALGVVVYLAAHRSRHSPELRWVGGAFDRPGRARP
jgi:putative peptidoglycan lipid II flippase